MGSLLFIIILSLIIFPHIYALKSAKYSKYLSSLIANRCLLKFKIHYGDDNYTKYIYWAYKIKLALYECDYATGEEIYEINKLRYGGGKYTPKLIYSDWVWVWW